MPTPTLFWKSTCTTCRDARKFLNDANIAFDEHNYTKQPLTVQVVQAIVTAAGGVAAVLNTRHEIAKANDWKVKPPGTVAFAQAVVAEPNLMRRPILLHGKTAIVGFDKDQYAALGG
jgi:arsenate reductase (glutaredoxin)